MPDDNPYPTFGSPSLPPIRSGGSSLGKVILGVFVGFIVLIFVGFKIIDCRRTDEYGTGGVTCDQRGPELREQWIQTRLKEFDDASPYESGFRVSGHCNVNLESKMLNCDESAVIEQEHDSPFVRAAAAHGFTTYVCIDVSSGKQTMIPLSKIIRR